MQLMGKNNPPKEHSAATPSKDIRNSLDPDIAGSYNAMQRAGQAAIDLAIQTNTVIVTTVDGKIVRITAAELIKQRQLSA